MGLVDNVVDRALAGSILGNRFHSPEAFAIIIVIIHNGIIALLELVGIGDKADFTVFRLEDCNQPVADSLGNSMVLTQMLEPVGTVIGASWQDAARRLE